MNLRLIVLIGAVLTTLAIGFSQLNATFSLKSYGVPSKIAFEHDGWWRPGPATEVGSLLTVKRGGSMKMQTLLSPGSHRP
jgi:hypothetical protein